MNNSWQQIDLVGPADRWFGFALGNQTMDNTYAIVIGADGSLSEHILGNHNPGWVYTALSMSMPMTAMIPYTVYTLLCSVALSLCTF